VAPEIEILNHRFSDAEYQRRRAETLRLADSVGAERVLAFGENRSGLHVTYLCGWAVTRQAWLSLDGEGARMWVSFHNHVPAARRMATDVEVNDIALLATSEFFAAQEIVATLGVVPAAVVAAAADAGVRLVPIDREHAELRAIKSDEEAVALRLGGRASDLGAQALIDACKVGATDWDLLAAARSAYTRAGGRDHICYICVTDMDAPDRDVPSQVPEGRMITDRSVVTFELSASVAPEYPGQILRTVFVGTPTEEYVRLHQVAEQAHDDMRAALREGASAQSVVAAARCIESSGFTTTDDLFHGLGMGYLDPVGVSPSRFPRAEPRGVVQRGMSIVVQPNVTTTDHRAGVQTGQMVLVTADGFEDLHDFQRGVVRAG